MKKTLFIFSLLFITTATFGQAGQATRTAKSDPTGLACTANSPVLEYQNGRYTCESSVYALTSVKRAAYAIASLPTCNASRVNVTVNVTDGNRGQRTCRNTDGSNYNWVDESLGIYDVQRFGAVDDGVLGVSGTNNLSAIQAAINAMLTAEGGIKGTLFFPRTNTGVYRVVGQLTVPNTAVSIVVEGADNYTYLEFPLLSSGQTAWTFTSSQRGLVIKNLRFRGPGNGVSGTTGLSLGAGATLDNVHIGEFATGVKTSTYNGLNVMPTCEFQANGIGLYVDSGDANYQNIGGRYFSNTIAAIQVDGAEAVNIHAWFELNTGNEIILNDVAQANISECWFESTAGQTPIVVNTTGSYLTNGIIAVRNNFFGATSATYLLDIDSGRDVVFSENAIDSVSPLVIKVNSQITNLTIRDNYVSRTSTTGDRGATAHITVSGSVLNIHGVPDLSAPPSRVLPLGGYAYESATNLISDPGFESALGVATAGTSAPTATWEAVTIHDGARAAKISWNSGSSGLAAQSATLNTRTFSATSGTTYLISFSLRASVSTRLLTLRPYSATFGSSANYIPFIDCLDGWQRYEFLWTCDSTQLDWSLQFTLAANSSVAITTYLDDVSVVSGTIRAPYLPDIATIPINTFATPNLAVNSLLGVGVAPTIGYVGRFKGTDPTFFLDGGTGSTAKFRIGSLDYSNNYTELNWGIGTTTFAIENNYPADATYGKIKLRQKISGNLTDVLVATAGSVSIPAGSLSLTNVAVAASAGAALSLDLSTGNIRTVTFGAGNITNLTATNIPTGEITIILIQDGGGSRTATWDTSIFKFPAATAPTLTTTGGAVDAINFVCNGTICRNTSTSLDIR